MQVEEIWKDIPQYERIYQVSTLGRVKALEKTVITGWNKVNRYYPENIKAQTSLKGYKTGNFRLNGKSKGELIHRLVAKTFIPNPENKPDVNHINGIKSDNRVENLEWCTEKENIQHAIKNNLYPDKERRGKAKINRLIASIIRKSSKDIPMVELARIFNVNPSLISNIVANRIWKEEN